MNTTKHPDYSREVLMRGEKTTRMMNGFERAAIEMLANAKKFMLPLQGLTGFAVEDVDRSLRLNLPFDIVALEFETVTPSPMKFVILANHDQTRDYIDVAVYEYDERGWGMYSEIYTIPRQDYSDGNGGFLISAINTETGVETALNTEDMKASGGFAIGRVVLMLNFLAAENVEVVVSKPSAVKLAMRKRIPYDSYHVLMLKPKKKYVGGSEGGTGSPKRQHIRRGHWNTSKLGKRYWVNDCVIHKDDGGSKVTKVYNLKGAL